MTAAIQLHCRITLDRPLDVFVEVVSGRTVFAHAGEDSPEGTQVSLYADDQGEPEHRAPSRASVSLPTLVLALDPARSQAWSGVMNSLLNIDNRVDADSSLRELIVHVDHLVRRWRAIESGYRNRAESALRKQDPALAGLISGWPDALAAEFTDAASARFAELQDAPARRLSEPDDEHWASWCARDPDEILGENGGLARLIGDRFELRAGQQDMATAVAKALDRHEHLMCEAGTGIGKSIGYLVPALLHGARQQQRVVVSTHTHTLQAQLIEQDLPLLQRLGYPGRARRLLGRNNYLCRRQLMRAMAQHCTDAESARARFALALWAMTSREGTREEISGHPWFASHWKSHFASIEPCSPHICQRDPVCFVVRARRDAREAQVVVVNHALLMMDVQGDQALIGPAAVLVVDEAHQLPDVATHALSVRIAETSIRVHENLAGDRDRPAALRAVFAVMARGSNEDIADAARTADAALEDFLRAYGSWLDALEAHFLGRLGAHSARPGQHRIHDAAEAFGPVRDLDARLTERGSSLATALATVLGLTGEGISGQNDLSAEREALARLLEYHDELVRQIRFVQDVADEDSVYWVDWAGSGGLRAIVAAPLAVAEPLAGAWDDHYGSVVMTSATLAVEADFMPFAESVGFDRVQRFTETLQVESPFSASEQSRLFSALDLPAPDDPRFAETLANVIAGISRSLVTRMLVLSTSYRLIDQLEPLLREALTGVEFDLFDRGQPVRPEILVQRPHSSRDALIASFRRSRSAVLLATGSFWEGVDFPGEQLEVLVVPRLPFPVPTDPVLEGRTERARRLGRDAFESVSLVDAVLRLKQGVGRLLRTTEDRGVVLLFDQRLQTRSYGVRFLNSLPRLVQFLPGHADMVDETVAFLSERARQ
ncbi:hypothetical protein DRQ53_02065, partial [bacterium]